MNKLSSADYDFTVVAQSGIHVTLTQVATGAVKTFFLASGRVESVSQHMNSLTDSQCEQWFSARKQVKKEKKA
jgi:hypothetical protein